MSKRANILLVGYGNMGRALAGGWLERGWPAASISVVDPDAGSRAAAERAGLAACAPGHESAGSRDVVVFAVKPQHLDAAAHAYVGLAGTEAVFLSIAAGRTIASLRAALAPGASVVRAMPNTPAAIGRGMTVLCASESVTPEQRRLSEELMTAVGAVEWVGDEALMDAVTAVSGSGPAYVFLLVESLAAAGVAAGLDAGIAARLATETVAGAGEYAIRAGVPAAELRRRVTSPNGTTQAALEVLMADDAFGDLMRRAVAAATARSRELARG